MDPSSKPTIAQVWQTLKKEGLDNEKIVQIAEEVAKLAADKFFTDAVSVLSDEDMQVINSCENEDQANFEVKTRFALTTGKNPDEVIQEYMAAFAEGFLEKYLKEKTTQAQ